MSPTSRSHRDHQRPDRPQRPSRPLIRTSFRGSGISGPTTAILAENADFILSESSDFIVQE